MIDWFMIVLGLLVGYFLWKGKVNLPKVGIVSIIIAIVVVYLFGIIGIVMFVIGLIIGFWLKNNKKDWKIG